MTVAGVSDRGWAICPIPLFRDPDGGTTFGARTSFRKAHVVLSLFTSMSKGNVLVELIEQIVSEEVDKALALSDKRRKKIAFTEIDNLNIGRSPLNLEADATTPAPGTPAAPAVPAPGTPTAPAPAAPVAVDPAATDTGTDPMTGTLPGLPGVSPTGNTVAGTGTAAGPGVTDMVAGLGTADPTMVPGGEAGMSVEPLGDPIDAMVSGAQELLNQTQDPNLILKSLKGQIQTVFKDPSHALGMVKALYDTNDSILQTVAQRLYLFIKSST